MDNDILQVQGINRRGYGIIPKIPMQDKRLTVEAKAIYAYFCSYAGTGRTAFPSRDKIMSDLGIGKDRFYAHYNLLKEYGYLSIDQEKAKNGTFKRNVYTLNETIPCPDYPDTVEPDTDEPDTVEPDTKINSFKINSFKINSEREGERRPPAPSDKKVYGDYKHVQLTSNDYGQLVAVYGKDITHDYIDQLDSAIECGRYEDKGGNHCAVIKRWIRRDERKGPDAVIKAQEPKRGRLNNFDTRRVDYAMIERLERQKLQDDIKNGLAGMRPLQAP